MRQTKAKGRPVSVRVDDWPIGQMIKMSEWGTIDAIWATGQLRDKASKEWDRQASDHGIRCECCNSRIGYLQSCIVAVDGFMPVRCRIDGIDWSASQVTIRFRVINRIEDVKA